MGTVVKFPQSARIVRDRRTIVRQPWPATVIILPVVRIERYDNMPSNPFSVGSNAVLGRSIELVGAQITRDSSTLL
jgi:hypothetical protein